MKFKLIETYTDYGYEKDGIELASDNSDEVPEEKVYFAPFKNEFKEYEVTIYNKPKQKIIARNPKEAAMICRSMYKRDKIKILGIKEI